MGESTVPQGAWLARAAVLAVLATSALPASAAQASSPPVSVFPIPGGRVAAPQTQITFRGVPAGQLGPIVVFGSRSGLHTGHVAAHSDGSGGSFLPDKPFAPGETVTVSTSLNIVGTEGGIFQFTVATPAGGLPPIHWPRAARVPHDVWRFHSRQDLAPAAVTLTRRGRTAPEDIFLAPQFGPVQDGVMILGAGGGLIWWNRLHGDDSAADFRVQSYQGRPVLTWWQGLVTGGIGAGEDVIEDSSYRQVATVRAGNGLAADLHEFELTPAGTALITAYYPVYWDASSVHLSSHRIVLDSVVQEIDIPTGLVLFQWDSLDHIPLTDTYESRPKHAGDPFDYFHVNSIEPDRDGTLIISGRNTWAAYKVSRQTGAVLWRLGGRRSNFRLPRGVGWAFQHDVRVHSSGDRVVTIFDDGGGPPFVHSQSRGLRLILDTRHRTAELVSRHVHAPALLANYEGNFQQLPDHDDFLGWGEEPYFSEYDRRGRDVLDGHFVGPNSSYRAYRFYWSATPTAPPAIATSRHRRTTVVYASWNGATSVSSWRVIAGNSASALRPVAFARKRGFETAITIRARRYAAVQALDGHGHVLATSPTVPVR